MLTALRLLMNWNVSVNTLTAAPVRQLPVTPQARFSHQPVLPPCLPRFALAERLQAPHQIRLPATHCLPVLLFYQVRVPYLHSRLQVTAVPRARQATVFQVSPPHLGQLQHLFPFHLRSRSHLHVPNLAPLLAPHHLYRASVDLQFQFLHHHL